MNYPVQQGYPAQQFAPAPPVQPQQQFAPQFPGYPQQGYPAAPPVQYAPPVQQAPQQPLAEGSLDAFYNQPSAATGPSISWTDAQRQPKPIGTSYVGFVARDVTNADVQQQTDFNTKAPLFYADGRPKFAMKVPLKVQPSQEFPEGEATFYVKGQARDELVRAMAEVGATGSPTAGALIQVTLVQRRASRAGLNPANVVAITYVPAGQGNGAASPAPAAPVQQAPAPQFQQVAQAPVPGPPAWAAPEPQYVAPPAQQVAQAPVQPQFQAPPAPQPVAPQAAAAPVPTSAPQPPSDLNPDQQALLAKLTGQTAPQAAQA